MYKNELKFDIMEHVTYYGYEYSARKGPTINGTVHKLLESLEKQTVFVDFERSKKKINRDNELYDKPLQFTEEKDDIVDEITVHVKTPKHTSLVFYLSDQDNRTTIHERGLDNMVLGGDAYVTEGVFCRMYFEGQIDQRDVVERTTKAILDAYTKK